MWLGHAMVVHLTLLAHWDAWDVLEAHSAAAHRLLPVLPRLLAVSWEDQEGCAVGWHVH